MNVLKSRRRFLQEVGKGTLLAAVGPAMATELGFGTTTDAGKAAKRDGRLHFGELEPLVGLMQDMPVELLQPWLLGQMKSGVSLRRLVAAGALANARSFGGEDYVGFHALMALGPALKMAEGLPKKEQALPVFKVLYRNTQRIQQRGGKESEVLRAVEAGSPADGEAVRRLHEAVKGKDKNEAERVLMGLMERGAREGLDGLLACVEDDTEVHRTVLPYRAWDLLDVVGHEHAATMLRMSLRYCVEAEGRRQPEWNEHGRVLSKLLDEHRLLGRGMGMRSMDDGELERLSEVIFSGSPEQSAGAVAAALAEGFSAQEVGEAISLAANQLILRDLGRPPEWEFTGKPTGSVHGDSVGVHVSDSVHAWRNLAQVGVGHHAVSCLILGAWQVARDRGTREFEKWQPAPSKRQVGLVKGTQPEQLLAELEEMIRAKMQSHASAVVHRWGLLGLPAEPVLAVLLKYAVSEDGALHAEKYFQTCKEEFHRTRAAFRWRHLTALARVTASEFGYPAAGQWEARELLGV